MARTPVVAQPTATPEVAPSLLPNVQFETKAPIEAFGGGADVERENEAVGKTIQTGTDIAERVKKDQDALRVQAAKLDFIQQKNQLMSQVSQMKGQDAFGAPELVDKQLGKIVPEANQGLQNDSQRAAFSSFLSEQRDAIDTHVSDHVTQQREEFTQKTHAAVINNYISDGLADYKNPEALAKTEKAIKDNVAQYSQITLGLHADTPEGKAQIEENQRNALSVLHGAVINQYLEAGEGQQARQYFDEHKGDIRDTSLHQIDTNVKSVENRQTAQEVYAKVKPFTLENGTPDMERQRNTIYQDESMTPEQKDRAWAFTKNMDNAVMKEKHQQTYSNVHTFMGKADDALAKGASYSDIEKMANNATDSADVRRSKEKYAENLFKHQGSIKSDPHTYMDLWTQNQKGEAVQDNVEKAFQEGKLSNTDYKSLSKEVYNGATKGTTPAMKITWKKIDDLATVHYGDDKEGLAQFKYTMRVDAAGMTPEQLTEKADKLMTPTGKGKDTQAKSHFQALDAKDNAIGDLQNTVGIEGSSAIINTLERSLGHKVTGDDLQRYYRMVGGDAGINAIQKGTPKANAIDWLVGKKLPPTPKNIQWAEQQLLNSSNKGE